MGSKLNILILSIHLIVFILPSSQPRPVEIANFDFNRTRSLHHGGNGRSSSSAIVRVIASSSSSSSSVVGHGGHSSFHHRTIHQSGPTNQPQPPVTPTLSPSINFQPTTYHPQWQHLFQPQGGATQTGTQSEFQQPTFQRPPLELRQPGYHFLNRSPPQPPHQPPPEFFSLFSNQKERGQTRSFKSPSDPPPPPEPIVSVVSSSHTVSEASATASQGEQRVTYRKSINQDPQRPQRHKGQPKVQKRRIVTRVDHPRRRSDEVDDDDRFMFQSDQPHQPPLTTPESSSMIREWKVPESEKVWGESEKVWGEPEKVWGEPEKVWGEPEKVWGEPEKVWDSSGDEKWEPKKELPKTAEGEDATDPDFRFYELGEDEDDEPKELVLDKSAMEATIETAQLAARSWELPELRHHLSLVPPESLVRSSSDRMSPDSIQIPFRTNSALMPKVRLTLEGGGGKAKSIPSDDNDDDEPAKKIQFQEGTSSGKKFGYVLDGNKVRKYRVEERTPDGFIVGEYGVLNHNNGFLRGVRYTADGSINPRLIHEALMKFLSL